MTLAELKKKLYKLINLPAEVEWLEFKEAKNNFDFDNLGRYFSALSNEANLKKQECGWLIFGVTDKPPRKIVGSYYKSPRPTLDKLKRQIAENMNNQLTFDEIHELNLPEGRVLMFQIPKALHGMPTAWKGHFYGRDGESLGALSLNEIEQIRGQVTREDWSVKICEGATLKDLDPAAIRFAREEYKKKYSKLVEEINKWSDLTFLNKAKVCINGRITNTAIVLLGKEESAHFLSPTRSQLTWIIKDKQGIEKDYKHFGPPLILAVNQVYGMIRNLTYRYMESATLFRDTAQLYCPSRLHTGRAN